MKKLFILLVSYIITTYILTNLVLAEPIFQDTFTDTVSIDLTQTTALVDTVNGEISLPRARIPNALAVSRFQDEFAVINGSGIDYYAFDQGTNSVVRNDLLNINDITDPVGIAAGQGDYSLWVLTGSEIRRYDFTGSGMSHNPYLSVTGLTDVFSICSNPLDDTVISLSEDMSGKGIITTYKSVAEGGGMQTVPQLSFNTGLEDPSAVSMVPDSSDIIVSAGDSVYYYSFEAASGTYVQNAMMTVATGMPINSISLNQTGDGYMVSGQTASDYYLYDLNLSKMERVPLLSSTSENYQYSVSLKQGAYEYAVLTEDGTVQYWIMDSATGSIVRNPAMETAGIAVFKKYYTPREYVSTVRNTAINYDEIRVTANTEIPEGASINWSAKCGNDSEWHTLVPGTWVNVPAFNSFYLKAQLVSPEGINQKTPKIFDVLLEGTKCEISSVECIAITKNDIGQVLPTSQFAVNAKQGSQIVFAADTLGYMQEVSAVYSTGEQQMLKPENSLENEKNRWYGSITLEPDAQEGEIISLSLTGRKPAKVVDYNIDRFIEIKDNVIYDMDVNLTR